MAPHTSPSHAAAADERQHACLAHGLTHIQFSSLTCFTSKPALALACGAPVGPASGVRASDRMRQGVSKKKERK